MKTTTLKKRNAYLVIGSIGVLYSVGYLIMSFQFPFGQMDNPGAGVFPVIVGVILMLASLNTMLEGWKMHKAEQIHIPANADRKRLLSLISLLFGCVFLLPWLGQIITSVLFFIFLMRILSDLKWPRIILYSLVMSIVLYLVFVHLLKVPMPRGVLSF